MYKRGIERRITSGFLSLFHFNAYRNYLTLSNPVNADIEGSIESVRIKRIEFRGNVRAFFITNSSRALSLGNEVFRIKRGTVRTQ